MSCDCERLAEAIYREIKRQLPKRAGAELICSDLQSVVVDGQLDLLKIAASLSTRFCVLPDNLETVSAERPAADDRMMV